MTGNKLRLRKLWFTFGILLLLIVAILSLTPVPMDGPENFDKIVHVLLYVFLSGWFSLLVAKPGNLWWSFTLLAVYGFIMEVLQGMTGYRSFEVADAIANSIGAALGVLVYFSRLRAVLIRVDQRLSAFL